MKRKISLFLLLSILLALLIRSLAVKKERRMEYFVG